MQAATPSRLLAAAILAPLLLFCHLLRACGLRFLMIVGTTLGELLYVLHFRRSVVRSNLDLALGGERSGASLDALCRDIYRHTGCTFLEIARNFALSQRQMQSELLLDEPDRRRIEELVARGKGVVFISAHIGNWELLATGMAARGLPLTIVVKKMNNAISQLLIERQRARTGIEIIYSGGTIEKMKAALRRGRVIGFMVDQNTTGKKGIRCNFFGVPASCIRALGAMIEETGAAVVPICAFREPDGRHRVQILPELIYLRDESLAAGSEERRLREEWLNAQQYQHALEAMVRLHPEQWLWIHRRWKARREPLCLGREHQENVEKN